MDILFDVSDDLLSMSKGDIGAYRKATTSFLSSFKPALSSFEATEVFEHQVESAEE